MASTNDLRITRNITQSLEKKDASNKLKQQASSAKRLESQAASVKPRAASIKRQAASSKLPNNFSFIKFPVSRNERLYQDKCVVWMSYMKRNLVWREPQNITFSYFEFNCKKVFVFIVSKQVRNAWKCHIF